MNVVQDIVERVKQAIGDGPRDLHAAPFLEEHARVYSHREAIEVFERELRRICAVKHAVALSSGTAALHLALRACGVTSGTEVVVPTLTFAATANAIVHAGAIPHFVDVGSDRQFGISPKSLAEYLGALIVHDDLQERPVNRHTGRPIGAIMPVHLLGWPCEELELKAIAIAAGVPLIVDACEALGSKDSMGAPCGSFGHAAALSFNLNKVVTTGGGGALLTDSASVADTARYLASQCKEPHPFLWRHTGIGFNYRMPGICADVGIPQLARLNETLELKAGLAMRYWQAFATCMNAYFLEPPVGSNNWLNTIRLTVEYQHERDNVIRALIAEGYEARALFTPLHLLPPYRYFPQMARLDVAEDLFRSVICLPSTPWRGS